MVYQSGDLKFYKLRFKIVLLKIFVPNFKLVL